MPICSARMGRCRRGCDRRPGFLGLAQDIAILWGRPHRCGPTFPNMTKQIDIDRLIRHRAALAEQWRTNHADRARLEIELDRASTLLAELTDLGLPLRSLRGEIPSLLAGGGYGRSASTTENFMSLSPLNRGSDFAHEHRAELRRQQRIAQQNLEQERMRHEREQALRQGDLRRQQAALREREDLLIEREARIRGLERDASTAAAETMAGELHVDVADHAPITGDRAALVQAVFAARNKALGLTLPDRPTHPVARAAIELYEKLTGLTDDTPAPTGLAAQALAAARKSGLAR